MGGRVTSLLCCVAALTLFALVVVGKNVRTGPALAEQGNDQDYRTFKHTSSAHVQKACTACHQRPGDNSSKPVFPVHSACQGCHLNQFLTPASPMCVICHSDVNGQKPPLKGFPATFKESFNIKFDHPQHMNGSAKPKNGCAFCHSRPLNRGTALSIPAGLSAHSQCYTCHTPGSKTGAGKEMASCGTCHEEKKYGRVSANSRAFQLAFSHAQHGPKQRLDCTACHSLAAGAGFGRQVVSPRSTMHFSPAGGQNCTTCHNDKRSFGEANFKACRKCHTGKTFSFRA